MSNYLDVVYDPPGRNCKDCISEFTYCQRPSPHPGPRCKTHALAKRNSARRTKHQSYVEKQFNLPPGDYDKLKEYQAGKCAICQRATGKTRNLAVDHDHKHCDDCKGSTSCGKGVRGLLCMRCNSLLAHIRDNKEAARRVFEYLNHPPYQRMHPEFTGNTLPMIAVKSEDLVYKPDHLDQLYREIWEQRGPKDLS